VSDISGTQGGDFHLVIFPKKQARFRGGSEKKRALLREKREKRKSSPRGLFRNRTFWPQCEGNWLLGAPYVDARKSH